MKTWEWRAMIISILLSCTFWFFHALNDEHTANLKVPLQVRLPGKDTLPLVEVVAPPPYLHINVTGYGWNILRKTFGIGLDSLDILLTNPLKQKSIASKKFKMRIEEMFSDMKSVNYLREDTLFFDYDTTGLRTIQLALLPDSIALKENYRITSAIHLNPAEISLAGPVSLLQNIAETLYLSPTEKEIDEDYEESLLHPFAEKKLLTSDFNKIQIDFEVRLFVKQQISIPLNIVNLPADKSCRIIPPEITLNYFLLETEKFTEADHPIALLDYKDYQKKDSTIAPMLYLPQKMKEVRCTPEKFKVILTSEQN